MKPSLFCICILLLLITVSQAGWCAAPLPTDPLAIRTELRALRKKAADNNPQVGARIDALMKQLQKLQGERDAAESQARGEAKPVEEGEEAAATREKMYEQVQKAAAKGKGAELDLAEPVRDQIIKEYEEDRDQTIKNPGYYQEQTVLVIDLSRKESQLVIDVMDKFTGIKTLILTGGEHGAPVDLPGILNKAKNYPLTELHIFNFRNFLTAVPESVGGFAGLTKLSLFNNNIKQLPTAVAKMKQLRVLHLDVNPIATILPKIKGLFALTEIGVGKTNISTAELAQLAKLLPNCRIVTE
ncbi:leucine Rich repeats [Geobacter sp. OR-1]|uniref:leucine-rich repeat domain-containing protein n=1 Tax=Geobacter sp. OR-1 TaxID=1266765 RepID=UPI000541CE62|nr:leucine-rich repeat domain-containing protein [Geobacter sp. OR-1]GAM08073.1 leucine Rich repeats [Geobacter sp. OR-1]